MELDSRIIEWKKDSWIIHVEERVRHLADIRGAEMEDWEKHSIYKLPAYVTDLNKRAYTPQAISFGPYHYGKPNLKPMEVHKERALLHFLKRTGKSPEDCVCALGGILQHLKDAYTVLEDRWLNDSGAFLELMLRDGCFMIEILRASSTDNQTGEAGYAPNDPIFGAHGRLHAMPLIRRDMLVLENQLPMPLLQTLLAINNQHKGRQRDEENVNKLIHQFYFPDKPRKLGTSLHVLDAYRRTLLWTPTTSPVQTTTPVQDLPAYSPGPVDILSVRELQEAGIDIKNSRDTSPKAIHFDPKTGVLSLPRIIVDDVSETMFLNLVAFERFHVGAGNEATDYICFMDDIIDDATDVRILERRGIIQNAIGSDRAVAILFKSIARGVSLDEHSRVTKVRREIYRHCRQLDAIGKARLKWFEWRAALLETYLKNPWAFISVVGAIILFGVAITQTTYGALQYYQALNNSPSPPLPPPPLRRS